MFKGKFNTLKGVYDPWRGVYGPRVFLGRKIIFTPERQGFGVLSSYMQVYKSYLSPRSDLEGFWGFKTPLMGVYGPRVLLGHKHMIWPLLDVLNTNLHVKWAKQQVRVDHLLVWGSKWAVFGSKATCRERVKREREKGLNGVHSPLYRGWACGSVLIYPILTLNGAFGRTRLSYRNPAGSNLEIF